MKHSLAGAALAALLAAGAAAAQQYPSKNVRLVVGFPAGGPADFFARTIGQRMSEATGSQVVVENRAGASGMVAAEHVSRAPADAHTLYFSSAGALVFLPHLLSKPLVDVRKTLAPVTLAVNVPEILVVHPSIPARNMAEFVALARAKPKALTFGSTGNGGMPHLADESLKMAARIDTVNVPYKGAAPVVADILGGHTSYTILDVPVLLPHIRSGKLRPIAIATARRSPLLPDVPTTAEVGYPSVKADNWYGVMAPAGTPQQARTAAAAALQKALRSDEVRKRFADQGAEAVGSSVGEFEAFLRTEFDKWGGIIRAANVRIE